MSLDEQLRSIVKEELNRQGNGCVAVERKIDALLRRDASPGPRLQYGTAEAAYLLGVSDRWLVTLESEYGLQSHKIGSKKFYRHDELTRFVTEQADTLTNFETATSPSLN